MKKEVRKNLFHKKECNRTRKEKLFRDVACYSVTIFAALMWFLLIEANANLADAESDFASASVDAVQYLN